MSKLNAYQIAACQVYGAGDFAHIAECGETWRGEAESCGDTLFLFLMIELSDAEGCEDAAMSLRRVETAIQDLETVKRRLECLNGEHRTARGKCTVCGETAKP